MKAALKFIMTLAGLLLIGLNIGTVLLLTQFEGTLRDLLTRRAGQILQADVHMEAVRIDVPARAIVFKGVSILNPEGFTDRQALWFDSVQVHPRPLRVFAKSPAIKEVVLVGTELHLQYKTDTGTNLGALKDNARQWIERQAAGDRWVVGRPVTVEEINAGALTLHVKSIEPPSPEVALSAEPIQVALPGEGATASGARAMFLVLDSLSTQVLSAGGLGAPVREFLLGESELESAAVPAAPSPDLGL